MKNHKINAYTLLEVTIGMLLSALVISICYKVYDITSLYYRELQIKQRLAGDITELKHILERDFLAATAIIGNQKGIIVETPNGAISYAFDEQNVVRVQTGIHADTFKVNPTRPVFMFEENIIAEPDTIDMLLFTMHPQVKMPVKIRIDKKYSSQDLFN